MFKLKYHPGMGAWAKDFATGEELDKHLWDYFNGCPEAFKKEFVAPFEVHGLQPSREDLFYLMNEGCEFGLYEYDEFDECWILSMGVP